VRARFVIATMYDDHVPEVRCYVGALFSEPRFWPWLGS
jgi:hypothetical protein